jgi:large subunit ribosomal protein L10e
MSVRAKDQHRDQVVESLRRAKFKFPGRQKVRGRGRVRYGRRMIYDCRVWVQVVLSRKWGFTDFNREDYTSKKDAGRLRSDGAYVQEIKDHGPLGY